jgi:acyl-CoA thioesterase FadM
MLFLRLIKVLISSALKPKMGFNDLSTISSRVWLNDIDVNVHMNNSRYLAVMDLGRFDMLMRSGLWKMMRIHKWRPMVGSSLVVYRKSLLPFQAFTIESQVVGWDDKWFYFDQKIISKGQVYCYAYIKCLFVKHGKKITTHELLKTLNFDEPSPLLPEALQAWRKAEHILKEQNKTV